MFDARYRCVVHKDVAPDHGVALSLKDHAGNEPHTIVCGGMPISMRLLDDGPAVGLAAISREASGEGEGHLRRAYRI